jgi:D-glycerate 3-kinase
MRASLANQVHPLFATRGVPGTHDTKLGQRVLGALLSMQQGDVVRIPRFDKAIDDRLAESDWVEVTQPVDIIIFEGWCVGLSAQLDSDLMDPINSLEAEQDPQAHWRRHVNECLANEYQALFAHIDCLLVLSAPSFDCVFEWRMLQEQKLIDCLATGEQKIRASKADRTMSSEEIMRFIQHFERLTRHALDTLADRADWVFSLRADHSISAFTKLSRAVDEQSCSN